MNSLEDRKSNPRRRDRERPARHDLIKPTRERVARVRRWAMGSPRWWTPCPPTAWVSPAPCFAPGGCTAFSDFPRKEIVGSGFVVPSIVDALPVLISKDCSLAKREAIDPSLRQHRPNRMTGSNKFTSATAFPSPQHSDGPATV